MHIQKEIEREKERFRERDIALSLSLSLSIYIYIYIYVICPLGGARGEPAVVHVHRPDGLAHGPQGP